MQYSKCKDSTPQETIHKIKNILNEIGIIPEESQWINITDKQPQPVFVKRLFYKDNSLGSNGKGTTEEYGLASAYAEFMERLENLHLSKNIKVTIPDLKKIPQKKFCEHNDDLADETFFRYLYSQTGILEKKDNKPLDSIIRELQNFVNANPDSDLECVPFYNLKSSKIRWLPQNILTQINTTNGMAAGNTPQEAIVQGISELIERYVQRNIYLKNLICPIIPENEYINYEEIEKLITFYNNFGIKVQIRDASLGEKWPAVCVIFINLTQGTYTMKFAASPSFPVAVERCLTEYAQCNDITNHQYTLPHYSVINDKNLFEYSEVEKINIFNTHSFPFSNTFFTSEKYSWDYDKTVWTENNNNKDNLKYLIDLILNNSFDIYIRDVSFLNFPAFHIHIPQMSNFLINVTREFETQINYVKQYFEKYVDDFNFKLLVPYIFNYYHEINLGINILNKNYQNALEETDELINKFGNAPDIIILKCLKEYIKMKIEKYNDKKIVELLSVFYGKKITEHVFAYCVKPNYLENIIFEISNNINKLQTQEPMLTLTNTEKYLSDILTEKYNSNIPNQENLIPNILL